MTRIYIEFNENDPEEMAAYAALESLGRINKVRLIRLLIKRAVKDYGPLFNKKYARALFEMISSGSFLAEPGIQVPSAPKKTERHIPARKKKDASAQPVASYPPAIKAENTKEATEPDPAPAPVSPDNTGQTEDVFSLMDRIHNSMEE